MTDHPLRLKIFVLLYILNLMLTYEMAMRNLESLAEALPPQFSIWVWLDTLAFYFACLVLLVAVWIRNRIGYILALLFLSGEITSYFIIYPAEPTIFLIIESAQLALLLSLFNHFFEKP